MIYLIYAYGWDWHRIIATKSNKDTAINTARTSDAPRGCEVWEFELNGGEGKKIYPNWN